MAVIFDQEKDEISLEGIVIETYKGTGPGGQHKNKTETAVRITHPCGIVVTQDSRSQKQNKENALKELKRRLQNIADEQNIEAENEARRDQIGKGYRGDKIRTVQFQNNKVINHTNKKKCNLDTYLKGNLKKIQ